MISKTYKVRMYPTQEQAAILRRWGNALRGVWNCSIREGRAEWEHAQRDHVVEGRWEDDGGPVYQRRPIFHDEKVKVKIVGLYQRANAGPSWMQDPPANMRSQLAQHLDAAWKAWKKTGKPPVVHSTRGRLSMSCQGVRFVGDSSILLPVASNLTAQEKQVMKTPIALAESAKPILEAVRPGRGKRGKSPARPPGWKGANGDVATISYVAGCWYVCFPVVEHHPPAPRHEQLISRGKECVDVLGIDANTAMHGYVCSDGVVYRPPDKMAHMADSVRYAQRNLARCVKKSRHWYRAKDVLAKRSAKLARIRKDWLNKITYDIATRAHVVVVEDLSVKNMTASAKGTLEDPGTNVAAKSGLNRAILHVAFGELRAMLEYKCKWYGSRLEVVNPRNTSRECSRCRNVKDGLTLSMRTYECEKCGLVMDRDVNAATTIRERFLRQNAQKVPGATGFTGGTEVVQSDNYNQASINGGDTHAGEAGFTCKGTVTPSPQKYG